MYKIECMRNGTDRLSVGETGLGETGIPRNDLGGNGVCVHGSTNGNNGIPISFKDLPLVIPLVPFLVPMVPLVKTDGNQYYRQSTVWAK